MIPAKGTSRYAINVQCDHSGGCSVEDCVCISGERTRYVAAIRYIKENSRFIHSCGDMHTHVLITESKAAGRCNSIWEGE